MSITITVPAELEPLILRRAQATGKGIEEITLELIVQGLQSQQPQLTFDEILAPFRKEVVDSNVTDEELEALVEKAREDFYFNCLSEANK